MDVRILGPLEIAGVPDLGGRRQRSVLAFLLLAAGSTVSVEEVIDGVWGDEPPASGRHLVQVYVSTLRRILPSFLSLRTEPTGYQLDISRARLDAARFEQEVEQARAAADPAEALQFYDEALGLWRGPVLAGLELGDAAAAAVRRLDSLRLTVIEERTDVALAAGRHGELVPELERLTAEEPLRERFAAQLMLALYRSGRQAEALAVYRTVRKRFAGELGVEPTSDLRALERAILEQDNSLALEGAVPVRAPATRRATHPLLITGLAVLVAAAAGVTLWLTHHSTTARFEPTSLAVLAGGRLGRSETLPASPAAAALGHGLWVIAGASRLLRFDKSGRLLRTYRIANHPRSLVVTPRTVWIGTGFDGRLTRLSSADGDTARIRPEPRSEGRLALATGFGSLWSASQDGILVRANPDNGRRIAHVRLRELPDALASGFGSIWVGGTGRQEIVRVNARTNKIAARIPVGGFVADVASGARKVWAVSPDNGAVSSINPRDDAVVSVTTVQGQPDRVAVNDGLVWVGSTSGPTLVALSEATGKLVRVVALPAPVAQLVAQGPRLWVLLR